MSVRQPTSRGVLHHLNYQLELSAILDNHNTQIDSWNRRGSGFVLDRVTRFVLCITNYRTLQCSTHIPTPEWLLNKRCVVKTENKDDNKCFVWNVLEHCTVYTPQHNPNRLTHYTSYEEGLVFPMTTTLYRASRTTNVLFFCRCARPSWSTSVPTPHLFATMVRSLYPV